MMAMITQMANDGSKGECIIKGNKRTVRFIHFIEQTKTYCLSACTTAIKR